MAFLHVDKIQYLDVVPLGQEQVSGIAEEFTLWVKHNVTGIGLTQVWLGKEPRFARAGAAADQRVQICLLYTSRCV